MEKDLGYVTGQDLEYEICDDEIFDEIEVQCEFDQPSGR